MVALHGNESSFPHTTLNNEPKIRNGSAARLVGAPSSPESDDPTKQTQSRPLGWHSDA